MASPTHALINEYFFSPFLLPNPTLVDPGAYFVLSRMYQKHSHSIHLKQIYYNLQPKPCKPSYRVTDKQRWYLCPLPTSPIKKVSKFASEVFPTHHFYLGSYLLFR